MKTTLLKVLALLMVFFLSGCGEKKCFFVTQEAQSLEEGAPVMWYEAYVGRVKSLEQIAEGTKVVISFNTKYNKEIHDGVTGRVVVDKDISSKPFVLLTGGRDKERSFVENGAQIPESKPSNFAQNDITAFIEWLKNSKSEELIIVGIILVFLFVLIRFVGKIIKFFFFVGIICTIGYMCLSTSIDWNNYKEKLTNVKESAQEAKAWLQEHGEKLSVILDATLETNKENK